MFNIKIQTFTLFFFFVLLFQIILSYLVWAKLVLSLPFFCPLCQCNLFTCPLDQYLKRFSIQFQGPEFFNSLIREIQNSESVGLFGKDLKSSFFLSHIYMVPFVERHTFSFFFFFNLLINHFSLSTLKGAVSWNSAKLGNYRMPIKQRETLKLWEKVKIT